MGLIIEIVFLITLGLILLVNLALFLLRRKLKQIENETKLSGMEIARIISSKYCEEEPHIIKKKGLFLDHYNSNRNVIKLSPEVFDGTNMYASMIAINVALETKNERIARGNYFATFIVLVSYVLIVLGAFLNNPNIINFGLIVFVLAFILVFCINTTYNKKEEIYKMLKKEKVLKPFDKEVEENLILASCIVIARLPYGFINYFR